MRLPGLYQQVPRSGSRTDADERQHLRFAMLGNAVTVDVARWLGERLNRLYECASRPPTLFTLINNCTVLRICTAGMTSGSSDSSFDGSLGPASTQQCTYPELVIL